MNFSTLWEHDYWMKSNGFYCGFNMPEALKGDKSFGLPPYARRNFYLADEYPAVPKNWVPSEGRKTSYFVPVQEDKGMWLDFNKNADHNYHVAIVVSVQGINPITGMPCVTPGLEQYIDQCPKHKIAFGPDRYCKECGYKWPKQNYISTTSTPKGALWLDGFRTAEGVVRQYILTMDKIKGVAANIIKEERVFAIGVSFFLSKEPKRNKDLGMYTRSKSLSHNLYSYSGASFTDNNFVNYNQYKTYNISDSDSLSIDEVGDVPDSSSNFGIACAAAGAAAAPAPSNDVDKACSNPTKGTFKCGKTLNSSNVLRSRSINVKKIEVGAGANINQTINSDVEPLSFWRDEVESIICINYVLEEDCSKILQAGKISLEGDKEGFLKSVPVGN